MAILEDLPSTNTPLSASVLFNAMYPVGCIYQTTDQYFNPNTDFGIGTWSQIKDRFLLSAGDTYTGGATGGSANMPAHTHTMAADFYIRHGSTSGTNIVAAGTNTTVTNASYSESWANGISTSTYSHKPDKVAISGNTGSTGTGDQGNMPPYLVVYTWTRTA